MEVISQLVLFRYEPKFILLMLLCDDESAKKEKKKTEDEWFSGSVFFYTEKSDFLQDFYTTVKKNMYIYI